MYRDPFFTGFRIFPDLQNPAGIPALPEFRYIPTPQCLHSLTDLALITRHIQRRILILKKPQSSGHNLTYVL